MKGHVKRAIEVAETLDFRLDEQASHHGTRVYWHPNSPDERIKLFSGATEPACIAFIRKANTIADTGWTGPAMPRTIASRIRTKSAESKQRRQREIAAHNERGLKAEQHYQNWRAIEAAERQRRQIEQLMMPSR